MAIQTVFEAQWESFRNLLSNRQLLNLSALLQGALRLKKIDQGKLHITIVTPEPKAAVFVYRRGHVLHIIGGHWLRKGEPTQDFLRLVRRTVQRLEKIP
jgi:hypothetical protein